VGYDGDLDYLRDQADSGDDVTHEDVDIFEDAYKTPPGIRPEDVWHDGLSPSQTLVRNGGRAGSWRAPLRVRDSSPGRPRNVGETTSGPRANSRSTGASLGVLTCPADRVRCGTDVAQDEKQRSTTTTHEMHNRRSRHSSAHPKVTNPSGSDVEVELELSPHGWQPLVRTVPAADLQLRRWP
jgi:hypothetical protein